MSETVMATATARRMTVREFWELPPVPGEWHQLIDGEVVVAASPVAGHQRAITTMFRALDDQLSPTGAAVFVAPLDVVLGPHTVVQPDVIVYDAEAAATIDPRSLPESLPAIVVEVLSPSSTSIDLLKKRDRYQRAGIAEYWVVDWEARTITPLRLVEGHYVNGGELTDGDVLTSDQFPGLRIAVSDVLPAA